MQETQKKIARAIRECGGGLTVYEGFSPFTNLLRKFACDKNIAAFSEACQQIFSTDLPNQWAIQEHAPKILRNHYLPKMLEPQCLSGLIANVSALDARLRKVLSNPIKLQAELDWIIEGIRRSAQFQSAHGDRFLQPARKEYTR